VKEREDRENETRDVEAWKTENSFWDAYQKLRQEFDFTELDIDPDSVFADVRDPSPRRDFSW